MKDGTDPDSVKYYFCKDCTRQGVHRKIKKLDAVAKEYIGNLEDLKAVLGEESDEDDD